MKLGLMAMAVVAAACLDAREAAAQQTTHGCAVTRFLQLPKAVC